MEEKIKQLLLNNAEAIFGQEINEGLIQFQKTRKDVNGDMTLVTFPFVKMLKTSPEKAGEQIGEYLIKNVPEVDGYEVVKGFLNLVLTDTFWIDVLESIHKDDEFGYAKEQSGKTSMVEYSSPNTNKPLHLGHLRNNFLGYSVAEILKANGDVVIKTQIINDRGIHICKSMVAWQLFAPVDEKGNRETPKSTGLKGDHFVGKYYIEFDKQVTQQGFDLALSWKDSYYEDCEQELGEKLE